MDPTWNTAAAKVPSFLASLKRHDYLYNRTKGALSLYTRGYITDNKNRKVVLGWRHLEHILANPTKRYTFEEPSPLSTYAATVAAAELASKTRLGAHPVYASGDSADAKKLKDDNAKAVEKELFSTFSIAPTTIEDLDRESATVIQSLITNEVYSRRLFKANNESGREMIRALHVLKKSISDKSKRNLLKVLEDRVAAGLDATTVEAFNRFVEEVVLINDELKVPKSEADLGEYYLEAARDALGDLLQVKLDVKIDALTAGPGWLDNVEATIINQITEVEDEAAPKAGSVI